MLGSLHSFDMSRGQSRCLAFFRLPSWLLADFSGNDVCLISSRNGGQRVPLGSRDSIGVSISLFPSSLSVSRFRSVVKHQFSLFFNASSDRSGSLGGNLSSPANCPSPCLLFIPNLLVLPMVLLTKGCPFRVRGSSETRSARVVATLK